MVTNECRNLFKNLLPLQFRLNTFIFEISRKNVDPSVPSVHSGKSVAAECRRGCRHRVVVVAGRPGQGSCPVVSSRHSLDVRNQGTGRRADGRAAAVVDVGRATGWGFGRVGLSVGWRHQAVVDVVVVGRAGEVGALVAPGRRGQRVVVQRRHLQKNILFV